MMLFANIFHKETTTEKINRLNFSRQEEVRKWEGSSPDSAHEHFARSTQSFLWTPKNANRWVQLESSSRYQNHRPPRWITQLAEKTWDNHLEKAVGVPIFLHRRFITYKIDYNDYDGYIIFKGLKPPSITRIDSQLQQLRRKTKYERS